MKHTFTASVWQEDDWYIAQAREIEVTSQGETEQEALANLREAIELHFEPPRATIVPRIYTIEVDIDADVEAEIDATQTPALSGSRG